MWAAMHTVDTFLKCHVCLVLFFVFFAECGHFNSPFFLEVFELLIILKIIWCFWLMIGWIFFFSDSRRALFFISLWIYICNVVHTYIVTYKNTVVHMSALGRIWRCNIYSDKVEHVSGYMFDCNSTTLTLLIKAATGSFHFCWLWWPLWTESGVSPLCCKYPDPASLWICLKVCETKTQKISSLSTAICTIYADEVTYPSVATQLITVLDNVETKL